MSQVIDRTGYITDIWAGTEVPMLADYQGGDAVQMSVEDDPFDLEELFSQLNLIVIPFASSADGRGFSLSAQLRDLGFTGHIRAKGHVLVDQFRAAIRSGFTDVEISDAQAVRNPERQWQSVTLQDGYRSRLLNVRDAIVNTHGVTEGSDSEPADHAVEKGFTDQ